MENFDITEKDRVFVRIATAKHGYADIDMERDADRLVLNHLYNLGLIDINANAGFGTRQRLSLTAKGREFYAKTSFDKERTKDIIEKIWKGLELLKP